MTHVVRNPGDQSGSRVKRVPTDQFGCRPPPPGADVDDMRADHKRLRGLGVRFTQAPVAMGPVTIAVFGDTCGSLVQIARQH